MSVKFVSETVLNAKDNTANAFANMQRNAKQAEGRFKGLQLAAERLTAVGVKMGGALVVAGAGITAGLLVPARNLSKQLKTIESLGVDASGLAKLEEAAQSFVKGYGGLSTDIVSAAYDLQSGMAGLNGDTLAGVTKSTMIFARATKANEAVATSFMGTMAGIFDKDYKTDGAEKFASRVGGMTAEAVKLYKTDGEQMAQSFENLGATASNLGIKMAEQEAILGKLQASMSGSEAGTAYKNLLLQTGNAQKKLGLSFTDTKGKIIPLVGMLDKIKSKYGDLEVLSKSTKLSEAFGDEGGGAVKLLIGDYKNLLSEIESLNRIANISPATKMADTMTDSWDRLSGSVTVARERIGKQFMPILEPLSERAAKAVDNLAAWAEKNHEMARNVAMVGGALAVAIPTLVIAGATVASIGVVAPVAAAGLAMLASPVVALSAAIAAGVLIWKNWGSIIDTLEQKFPAVHDFLVFDLPNAGTVVKDAFGNLSKWWDGLTFDDVGYGVGKYLRDGASMIMNKWGELSTWWGSTTFSEKFITLAGMINPIDRLWSLAVGAASWWSGWTPKEVEAKVTSASISAAWSVAEEFASWWNNLTLKDLIPKVIMPSMPTVGRMTGNISGAQGAFGGYVSGARLGAGLMSGLLGKPKPTGIMSGLPGIDGARANGGTVEAGGFYRVNEGGSELLDVAGRQYLMAAERGRVIPLHGYAQGMAANAPAFAEPFHAPLMGDATTAGGTVDTHLTVTLEPGEYFKVAQTGTETTKRGSLIRNCGVTMAAA